MISESGDQILIASVKSDPDRALGIALKVDHWEQVFGDILKIDEQDKKTYEKDLLKYASYFKSYYSEGYPCVCTDVVLQNFGFVSRRSQKVLY